MQMNLHNMFNSKNAFLTVKTTHCTFNTSGSPTQELDPPQWVRPNSIQGLWVLLVISDSNGYDVPQGNTNILISMLYYVQKHHFVPVSSLTDCDIMNFKIIEWNQ